MGFIITGVIAAAVVIFFCMDCAGKINRSAEGTGVIYLSAIFLLTAVLGIFAHVGSDNYAGLEDIAVQDDFWKDGLGTVLAFAGMCAVAMLPAVLSIIGCVRAALHNGKSSNEGMFGSLDDGTHCLSLHSKLSAVFGAICTVLFSIFAAVAAVKMFSFLALSSVELICITLVIGALTMGIGFILMAVMFPMWAILIGYGTIMSSLSWVLAAGVCGASLIVFQVLSAVFMWGQTRMLIENGSITKKKAVLYMFLSLLPAVSIINAVRIGKKVSVGA